MTLRILITRLSHIGDCVLTLPLACALRAGFPDARIVWAVERPSQKLLARHRAIDRLIDLPRGWLKSPGRVLALRRELLAERIDVAIDPQGLSKSAVVAWLSGAPRRIGFARGRGREIAPWLENERVVPQSSHLVDATLELLGPLGIGPPSVEFDLPRDADADRSMERFLETAGLAGSAFAVVNVGAGWPSKVWPAENFGALARALLEREGLPSVVVWAGEKEREMASVAASASGGRCLPAPPTSLVELAALSKAAALFVSADTGPLHMAAAVGTPCVGLYGPTRPADCGPYGPGHVSVQAYYRPGPARHRRRGPNDAMRAIAVEEALAACSQALAFRAASPRRSAA